MLPHRGQARSYRYVQAAKSISAIRRRNSPTLFNALRCAHLELPANQRTLLVDRAHHGVAIQRGTPTIVQAQHDFAAPIVGIDLTFRHTGVGNQHHFKLAAAGRTGRAGDGGVDDFGKGNGVHGRQSTAVGAHRVNALTDARLSGSQQRLPEAGDHGCSSAGGELESPGLLITRSTPSRPPDNGQSAGMDRGGRVI